MGTACRTWKIVVPALSLVLVGVTAACSRFYGPEACTNSSVNTTASPDGRWKVVRYVRACTLADEATHLSILPVAADLPGLDPLSQTPAERRIRWPGCRRRRRSEGSGVASRTSSRA